MHGGHADRLIANRHTARVRRGCPCPICEHESWCLADESAVLCRRATGTGAVGKFGEYGHLYVLNRGAQPRAVRKPPRPPSPTDLDRELRPKAAEWFLRATDSRRDVLAESLGVTGRSLGMLWVGWDGGAWTIPEWSGSGRIVGIQRRLARPRPDGPSKLQLPGGRRGLVYCETADMSSPVLIVEGMTDVAACLSMGVSAVGRPSNLGGVAFLVRLLGRCDGRLVVVGERDRKPHDSLPEPVRAKHSPHCPGCAACWPGQYGAKTVARQLGQRLGRAVLCVLPPGEAKDIRQWAQEHGGARPALTAALLRALHLKQKEGA